MVQRTRPQMRNRASGNLEIPDRRFASSGMTSANRSRTSMTRASGSRRGTRHQIDPERDRNDAQEIAKLEMLAKHEKGEEHAERRHQEVIGAGSGRAANLQKMEPEHIGEDRPAKHQEGKGTGEL